MLTRAVVPVTMFARTNVPAAFLADQEPPVRIGVMTTRALLVLSSVSMTSPSLIGTPTPTVPPPLLKVREYPSATRTISVDQLTRSNLFPELMNVTTPSAAVRVR